MLHEQFLRPILSETNQFKLDDLSDDTLNTFCEDTDFLSLMRLLNNFSTENHVDNITQLKSRMTMFCAEAKASGIFKACNSDRFMNMPLVYDTGASYGLTPFRSDFIDYQPCDIGVKDISKMNRVRGIGTVMYKMKATNGEIIFLAGLAYHLETADIRLFSPQTYHQIYGGSSDIDGDRVLMKLPQQPDLSIRHDIEIPIDRENTNLPLIYDVACSRVERQEIGPLFNSALSLTQKIFGFSVQWKVSVEDFDYEFDAYKRMLFPCVSSDQNKNLTQAQKELLLWHWKLGISMHRIQELMRGHQSKDRNGHYEWIPPVIKP